MLCVVRRLLFAVCCVLFDVYCSLLVFVGVRVFLCVCLHCVLVVVYVCGLV